MKVQKMVSLDLYTADLVKKIFTQGDFSYWVRSMIRQKADGGDPYAIETGIGLRALVAAVSTADIEDQERFKIFEQWQQNKIDFKLEDSE